MRRDAVRRGRFDQRARATTSRRRPRPERGAHGRVEQPILDWIDDHLDLWRSPQVDLGRYLHDTRHFDMEPDERLRWLGVSIERRCSAEDAWPAALRAYRFGLGRSEDPQWLLNSIAVTASELAPLLSGRRRSEVLAEALQAAQRAADLSPQEPDHRFAVGLICYGQRDYPAAIRAFQAGVALGDRGRCQIYVAHCLHDLERWPEALAAYDAVALGELPSRPTWRVDVLKEQRAHCRFHAGDPETARAEVDAIFARYSAEPHLAWWGMSAALRRLCQALGDPYPARFDALIEAGIAWDTARFSADADEE